MPRIAAVKGNLHLAGAMLLYAAGHLQIEGDSVQIKARGGVGAVTDRVRGASRQAPAKPKKGKKAAPKTAAGSWFDCAMKFLLPHAGWIP